ncbi:Adhesion G-protein coupled receptor D1 [Holothuria leucospilota]|uniref:Adhesion G-protein coupled receptor D1 n=1 Tax=Holothuria leucospilota TaxID=206669 RepID=A0A9Q1CJ93_HOLLE|nr:Adhesion G-protein coupled receptor D1 [Holothuria leucospilota]
MKPSNLFLICKMTVGLFILLLPASVYSIGNDGVETLECIGSIVCRPVLEKCLLQRCDCPPPSAGCSRYSHTSYDFWSSYCCGLIPSEFYSVANVLQVDNLTPLTDDAYTTRYRVTLWSRDESENATWKNTGNHILTWGNGDSYVPEYLSISDEFPTEIVTPSEPEVMDRISNISQSAGPFLQTQLDEYYDGESINKMAFDCEELFNTTCIVNNCSCWTSSSSFPASEDRTGIILPEYCSIVDSETYTVNTSSALSSLHNEITSINEWRNGTFGGWAPADNDSQPWIEFSDIKGNVSGLIIQGMAGDAIRTLGEFVVMDCLNGTSYETFNHHGGIFNSSTIHYTETFEYPLDCLMIYVLEPNDTKKVGFRAGLITCNDTNEYYQSAEDIACEAALILVDALNSTISETDNSEDPAEWISTTYQNVAEDVSAINESKFAKSFRQKFILEDINLDLFYKRNEDFKLGASFQSTSILPSRDGNSTNVSIQIPPEVFGEFPVDAKIAMVVGQTLAKTANGGANALINGSKGRIVSPMITLLTLVDDNYTSLNNLSMEFEFQADNDTEVMVGSFPELEEYQQQSEWNVEGCTSEINFTTSRVAIQCNHTTSFAVILLIHKRTLPPWLMRMADIITKVGCSLSITSLAVAMVTYILFRSKIDTYHFAIHFNLMAAILAALLIFIILVDDTEPELICQITKYSLQYLFLSIFFWMLCEGIHLYRKVITVFETKTRHIFVFYIIGWGMPLVLVAITIVSLNLLHKQEPPAVTSVPSKFAEEEPKVCFLSPKDDSIWYFAVPAIVIVAVNTYILLRITVVVVRAAKVQTQASAVKIYQAKTGIRSALLLMPLLGTTYVIGLAAAIHPIFELLFNVLNSLQGFFIALFYCGLNSEIRSAVRTALQRGQLARSILSSTTGKTGTGFNNKIAPMGATSSSTLIDSETMKKLHEI